MFTGGVTESTSPSNLDGTGEVDCSLAAVGAVGSMVALGEGSNRRDGSPRRNMVLAFLHQPAKRLCFGMGRTQVGRPECGMRPNPECERRSPDDLRRSAGHQANLIAGNSKLTGMNSRRQDENLHVVVAPSRFSTGGGDWSDACRLFPPRACHRRPRPTTQSIRQPQKFVVL